MRRNKIEEKLQLMVCEFLSMQYPKILFNSDLSGQYTNKITAVKNKKLRSGRGYPDLFIIQKNKYYSGLYIEFKKESPFRLDGKLKTDKHLKEQVNYHKKLRNQGFKVEFIWTFDDAIKLIKDYMKNQ